MKSPTRAKRMRWQRAKEAPTLSAAPTRSFAQLIIAGGMDHGRHILEWIDGALIFNACRLLELGY